MNSGNGLTYSNLIINQFVIPVISCIGLIGNVFAIIVLSKKNLRTQPGMSHLAGLASTDAIVLGFYLIIGWVPRSSFSEATCKLSFYGFASFSCYASVLVTMLTAERFAVLIYPFHRFTDSVKRIKFKAKFFLPLVFVLTTNSHLLYDAVHEYQGENSTHAFPCHISDGDPAKTVALVFHSFDFVVYFLLPAISVTVMNLGIAREVRRSSASLVQKNCSIRSETRQKNERRNITRSLLLVSTVFVIFQTPYNITTYVIIIKGDSSFTSISSLFHVLNCAIDFLLYHVSNRRFRTESENILSCFARKPIIEEQEMEPLRKKNKKTHEHTEPAPKHTFSICT